MIKVSEKKQLFNFKTAQQQLISAKEEFEEKIDLSCLDENLEEIENAEKKYIELIKWIVQMVAREILDELSNKITLMEVSNIEELALQCELDVIRRKQEAVSEIVALIMQQQKNTEIIRLICNQNLINKISSGKEFKKMRNILYTVTANWQVSKTA